MRKDSVLPGRQNSNSTIVYGGNFRHRNPHGIVYSNGRVVNQAQVEQL